ncbi:MAG TPA: DUF362 domain-containing protein [archaeon]|nr:DUF362 domain-containing protein [archaeon]
MSMGKLSRREFLAGMLAASAGMGTKGLRGESDRVILASATEPDPARSTRAAIGALGGMARFVKRGQSVMLLPNPQGRLEGASTRPEIVAEVARLCLEAGASRVEICSIHSGFRWRGTGIDQAAERTGARIWSPGQSGDWMSVEVPGGRRHKSLEVITPVVERDVLINMPIAKHHGSTRFTGTLKNLMGVNSSNTAWHSSTAYLVDSIVDLASVIRPALCVVDATVMLAENGPFGPGRTIRPWSVIAGVDPVAVDTYSAGLLGMKPENVATISQAAERGLGTLRLVERETGSNLKTFCGA